MTDFLFECLSEEMPVASQAFILDKAHDWVAVYLNKYGLLYESLRVFVTHRRWVVAATMLRYGEDHQGISEEVRGPKVDAPDDAVVGFLKSFGRSRSDLKIKTINQKSFFYLDIPSKRLDVVSLLSDMMQEFMTLVSWPQSMRWSMLKVKWIRPITNLMCLYGNSVVPIEFAGLESNDLTAGHRYLCGNVFFEVSGLKDYFSKLEGNYVFLDHDLRKAYIKDKIIKLVASRGLDVKIDNALLDRISGSLEWPVVFIGTIAEVFMDLPPQVLVNVMEVQQDYVPVYTNQLMLAPYFIGVANLESKYVVRGNEKVLAARLEDACFMIKQDLKHNLDYYAGRLDRIVFHNKLGSLRDKLKRILALVGYIIPIVPGADKEKVHRLVAIAKADLATAIVADFPALQGVMGRYYALYHKEDPLVADAIEEHYYPLKNTAVCTSNPLAIVLLIADRIDTMVGLLGAGEKSTSSRDPMGVKRTIFGVIRTAIENKLRFNIVKMIDHSVAVYVAHKQPGLFNNANSKAQLRSQLQSLFFDRLRTILKSQEIDTTIMEAVRYRDDIFLYSCQVKLLRDFVSTQLGKAFIQSFRRVMHLLSKEERKAAATFNHLYDPQWLLEKAESDLACKLDLVEDELVGYLKEQDLSSCLSALCALQVFINAFIDGVVINCDSSQIRENRLQLLSRVRWVCNGVVDFTHLID